ncbi:hypothetical protein [Dankookia sp. P2]|uniref:hypothetical protein n=1 Tax=Dankookia sp. P2 TaxID=3423955 RepID=UPI003D67951E
MHDSRRGRTRDLRRRTRRGLLDLILADYVSFRTSTVSRPWNWPASARPEAPFIFVSGTLGEEAAVEAVKRGRY